MPLACLTATAGGLPAGPGVRPGRVFPAGSSVCRQVRGARVVPAARRLGVAAADSLEPSTGLHRVAPFARRLAAVESIRGVAGRAVAPRQHGAAIDRGAAFSAAGGALGALPLCAAGRAGRRPASAPAAAAQVQPA